MSKWTLPALDEMHNYWDRQPSFPRDDKGRIVSKKCNMCGNGTLQYEGKGNWRCNGLADPEDPNKELEACEHYHIDGEPEVGAEGGV